VRQRKQGGNQEKISSAENFHIFTRWFYFEDQV